MFDLHVTMLIRFLPNRLLFWENPCLSDQCLNVSSRSDTRLYVFHNIDIDINECSFNKFADNLPLVKILIFQFN